AVNLLNRIDESKAQSWNKQYIKDAFKDHVHRYERLGTYTSPDGEKLDVLIVHLAEGSKLERARTAIRNFVAHHLKTRDEKDAALVAFVSPTEKQWRFSYVKMEYATVEKDSGKIGVEERLTPARRFSYLVGEGESCHTAQTRFLGLLQNMHVDPKLADIENAFSVEAVTKEFFTRYAQLFGEIHKALEKIIEKEKALQKEFATKSINPVDFAKKLMGQIVFLYFLQKKGWLGVMKGQGWGRGPHDFLRRLANSEYGKYNNFFNDILEPLFYDTLATDRGHEAWCMHFNCRIPFLNGGLFEPLSNYDWRTTDIRLPNRLFTNNDFVEEGITGTGVLDVFDRYNFTVNEAEPLEKEVAIDPEMLGKVFENLIEENRRKGLGAYYTPREIVHYMCQESLINYLDTTLNKDKETVPRKDIETFVHLGDQAAHYEAARLSGTKTYAPELPGTIETHARLIDEKLTDITVCDPAVGSGAFPVGMMTEIVRARSALTPYFNDIHERTPYHFKRHAIQSCLYGVDIDPSAVEIAKLRLWLSLLVDEEDVQQIKPLPNLDYKVVAGNSLLGVERNIFNDAVFQELEKLKPQYFDETDPNKKASLRQKIDELIHELTNGKETFDFEIYFSEVFHKKGGFDVVTGNPPYILLQNLNNSKNYYSKLISKFYCAQYKIDTYHLFTELSIHLLSNCGVLAFITPNTFLKNKHTNRLREIIVLNTRLCNIVLFYVPVFEYPSVDNLVFVCQKKLLSRTPNLFKIHEIKSSNFEEEVKTFKIFPQKNILPPEYIFALDSSDEDNELLGKIENGCKFLGEICGTYFGIQTFDRQKYVLPLPANEHFKPVIDGGNVFRYQLIPPVEYVDYRPQNIKSGGDEEIYKKERIVVRQIGKYPEGVLCPPRILTLNTIYNIYLKSKFYYIEYVLAIVNSSLIRFYWLKRFYDNKKTFPKIKKQPLESIPIKNIELHVQKSIVNLVHRILIEKQIDPKADTMESEREINRLIYELYGLTEEEIAIVEDIHL
ncbi:MAG: Eco57I restriction-modification methylase domain-containing protein, partial [Bacteroidales bacterium]|nr:Eco57I restriction-modification methylase domain-containing protein [Bacteroidales bacterium]